MAALSIYLVTRTDPVGWDEFDGFVAVAESEEVALALQPGPSDSWPVSTSDLEIALVGTAEPSINSSFILKSFRAG